MKKGPELLIGKKGDLFKNKDQSHVFEIIDFNEHTCTGTWKCVESGDCVELNRIYTSLSSWNTAYWTKLSTKKKNFNNLYSKLCESI